MFNAIFYQPLYNALVFLSSVVPGHDVGLAIIVLTILVRVVLFPLYQKSAATQLNLKKVEPEIAKIKEKYTDKQVQAEKLMEIYRVNKINPFVGIVVLLIQLPIVIALFWVFKGDFQFNPDLLYSFVSVPSSVGTHFLGLIDMTTKNIILAILVGVTQFIQMQISLPKIAKKENGKEPNLQEDFARSMNLQMKYFMPVFIGFIATGLASAVSLYWVTTNIFSIFQELYVRSVLKDKKTV